MEHSFDIVVAQKIGIPEAILLKHIYFWVEKNRANGAKLIDGSYWTYNTRKAFTTLFPYLSERQIQYALAKLEKLGYVRTANHNESKYDRTLWYTITPDGIAILQNCQMEVTKVSNGSDEIVRPIPDIKPDVNTDVSSKRSTTKRRSGTGVSVSREHAEDAMVMALRRSYNLE